MYIFRHFPERVCKIVDRLAWKMSEIAAPKPPEIEVLHYRDCQDGPRHAEYVYRVKGPVYIEPVAGFAITEAGVLIEASLATNFVLDPPLWRVATPSYLQFRRALNNPCEVLEVDKLVSLRHLWEWNYYHFNADVLGKLCLLDEVGIPENSPLLLGKYVDEVPFARPTIELEGLNKRNWLVQGTQFIKTNELVICRTRQSFVKRFSYVKAIPISETVASGQRRIYLTRSQSANRHVVNEDAFIPMLKKHHFEVVQTEGMSIREQVDLFASTRFLIGIHGAGMTNMMYRQGHRMGVLELYSENYKTTDHEYMACEFDFDYYKLAGRPAGGIPQHASFTIDIDHAESLVQEMINKETTDGKVCKHQEG